MDSIIITLINAIKPVKNRVYGHKLHHESFPLTASFLRTVLIFCITCIIPYAYKFSRDVNFVK